MNTTFLQRIAGDWCRRAFGMACYNDTQERAARVLEEAIELAQSVGLPVGQAAHLVRHVYSNKPGEFKQEVGGVAVTLMVLCESFDENLGALAEHEIARVLDKPIEHFQARHLEKAAAGITMAPRCPLCDFSLDLPNSTCPNDKHSPF